MQTADSGIAELDISQIIQKYQNMVYGIALTQLKHRSEADDVFQDVFLTYHRKNPAFESEAHRKAWLIRTAVVICKRYNLSPWHTHTVSLDDTDEVGEFTCETEEQNRLLDALRDLKPRYKIPIYLYYFENMPAELIARTLDIKYDNVRKRLSRGRQLLKDRLERDYFE